MVLCHTRSRRAALLLLCGAVLGSCADPSGPGPTEAPVEPITELPRALTASEVEVINRSNAFGFELSRQVVANEDRPNIVLSPLSASMALGMTLNGAAGATLEAMRSALALEGMTDEEINGSYRGLLDLLTSLDPSVQLTIANAVWANEDVEYHQVFFDVVKAAFDAAVESRDFADPQTLIEVNGWVADQTQGKIETILADLDPDLVMLLLNAIWFDGRWTTRFDGGDTRRAPFHPKGGPTINVDMMTIEASEFPLGAGGDWVAAELPYGGGAWSMVVVVPQGSRTAREMFGQLDPGAWGEIVGSLVPRNVDRLSIPKFTLEYDAFLNRALASMGMEIAFGPAADFTRLSPIGDRLCIDFVRQKTFIEVDEAGTRAAAVTAVGIGIESLGSTEFVADRPFVFALRERLSGTILFMGLVQDPTFKGAPAEPFAGQCHG
jgi:serpin B